MPNIIFSAVASLANVIQFLFWQLFHDTKSFSLCHPSSPWIVTSLCIGFYLHFDWIDIHETYIAKLFLHFDHGWKVFTLQSDIFWHDSIVHTYISYINSILLIWETRLPGKWRNRHYVIKIYYLRYLERIRSCCEDGWIYSLDRPLHWLSSIPMKLLSH